MIQLDAEGLSFLNVNLLRDWFEKSDSEFSDTDPYPVLLFYFRETVLPDLTEAIPENPYVEEIWSYYEGDDLVDERTVVRDPASGNLIHARNPEDGSPVPSTTLSWRLHTEDNQSAFLFPNPGDIPTGSTGFSDLPDPPGGEQWSIVAASPFIFELDPFLLSYVSGRLLPPSIDVEAEFSVVRVVEGEKVSVNEYTETATLSAGDSRTITDEEVFEYPQGNVPAEETYAAYALRNGVEIWRDSFPFSATESHFVSGPPIDREDPPFTIEPGHPGAESIRFNSVFNNGFAPFAGDLTRRFRTRTITEEWDGMAAQGNDILPSDLTGNRNWSLVFSFDWSEEGGGGELRDWNSVVVRDTAGGSLGFYGDDDWFFFVGSLATGLINSYRFTQQWWYFCPDGVRPSRSKETDPSLMALPAEPGAGEAVIQWSPDAYNSAGNLIYHIPPYSELLRVESDTQVVFERTFLYGGFSYVNRVTIDLSDEVTREDRLDEIEKTSSGGEDEWVSCREWREEGAFVVFADALTPGEGAFLRAGDGTLQFRTRLEFGAEAHTSDSQFSGTLEVFWTEVVLDYSNGTKTSENRSAAVSVNNEAETRWFSASISVPTDPGTVVLATGIRGRWSGTELYHDKPRIRAVTT